MQLILWALHELATCAGVFLALVALLLIISRFTQKKKDLGRPHGKAGDTAGEEVGNDLLDAKVQDEKLQRANRMLHEEKYTKVLKLFQSLEVSEMATNRRTAFGWLSVVVRSMLREGIPSDKVAEGIVHFFTSGCLRAEPASVNASVQLLVRLKQPQLLVCVFQQLLELYPKVEPEARVCSAVLSALGDSDDLALLRKLLAKFEKNQELKNSVMTEQAYAQVVRCCTNAGDLVLAEQYACESNDERLCSARVLQSLLKAFAKAGNMESALALVDSIHLNDHFTSHVKLNLRLKLFCEGGKLDEV